MPAIRIVVMIAALLAAAALPAAPLFEDSAVPDATLEGPLAELMRETESRKQRPFVFSTEGTEHAIKVCLPARAGSAFATSCRCG